MSVSLIQTLAMCKQEDGLSLVSCYININSAHAFLLSVDLVGFFS